MKRSVRKLQIGFEPCFAYRQDSVPDVRFTGSCVPPRNPHAPRGEGGGPSEFVALRPVAFASMSPRDALKGAFASARETAHAMRMARIAGRFLEPAAGPRFDRRFGFPVPARPR